MGTLPPLPIARASQLSCGPTDLCFCTTAGSFLCRSEPPDIASQNCIRDFKQTLPKSWTEAFAGPRRSFCEFYAKSKVREASEIFGRVVNAPRMSSGLTANNAFTTTLVLRTFGFLEEEKLLALIRSAHKQAPSICYGVMAALQHAPEEFRHRRAVPGCAQRIGVGQRSIPVDGLSGYRTGSPLMPGKMSYT